MSIRFLLISLIVSQSSFAYPPAPPSVIFGKVRGELGFGLTDGSTSLLLLADGEEAARTSILGSGVFGENYRLTLSMDLNPAKGAYRIESSSDLKTWEPVEFSRSDDPVNTFFIYKSEEIENITVLAEPAVTTGKVV